MATNNLGRIYICFYLNSDIYEQNHFAEKYAAVQREIKELKRHLAKKMDELAVFCNNIVK